MIRDSIDALASRFGRRLAVHLVGFAGPEEDFSMLELMASRPVQFGSCGKFHGANLSAESLSMAFASLSTSLTATKLELANSSRTVRDVRREARNTVDDLTLSDDWYAYGSNEILGRKKYSVEDRDWIDVALQTKSAQGVALRKRYFGEGAERLVRKFREVGPGGVFVGPHLVAKEGRFEADVDKVLIEDRVAFHKKFCETQTRAQKLATVFNHRLSLLPGVDDTVPRVKFLDCSVYLVDDGKLGTYGILVEKQLDQSKYKKWNDNCGFVDGQAQNIAETVGDDALEVIVEDDENDDEDEYEDVSYCYQVQAADIPQAFSHFTYRYTGRRKLVCDLQGVLSPPSACSKTPLYEFTDPVIHFVSLTGRKNRFGRTDRGKKGIQDFFKTHVCTELCRMLNKTWVRRAE